MANEEPYLRIARDVRDKIRAPRPAPGYRPGDRLPSIAEQRAETKRNHITVKRAYDVLISEGIVVSVPKVGYFVRRYPRLRYVMGPTHDPRGASHLPGRLDAWTTDVEAAGYLGKQEIGVTTTLGKTPLDVYTVGELLEIGPEDIAVQRSRIRYIAMDPDDPEYEPESLSNSYYPLKLARAAGLTQEGSINTAKRLHDLGHPQVVIDHEMIARLPDEEENRRLRLPRGSAVMERITIARDPNRRPVYVQHIVTAGNGSRHCFQTDYTTGGETP